MCSGLRWRARSFGEGEGEELYDGGMVKVFDVPACILESGGGGDNPIGT